MIFLGGFLARAIKSPVFWIIALLAILIGIWFTSSIFSDIGTFLGFDTKANLKKELAVEKQNVGVLKEVNQGNQVALEISKGTNENTVKALENVEAKAEKTDRRIQEVKTKVQAKVEEVKVQNIPPEEKEAKVSEVRLRGLWDIYCGGNTSTECQANTTPVTETNGA